MKKYYLIYFSNQWNQQRPTFDNDVIDISPTEWLIKWRSGESNGLHYQQLLINVWEITKEEYDLLKQKKIF